jgi:hypothetical protein
MTYFVYENENRIFKPAEVDKKCTKIQRRKMKGMNQFGIQYLDTWTCHNETLCIDLSNKNKCLFSQAGRAGR